MSDPNGYDPNRVQAVVDELEANSIEFRNFELQNIVSAKQYLEAGEEVPRWLLVKLSMMSRKLR